VEWNVGLQGYGEEFLPIAGLFQHPRLITTARASVTTVTANVPVNRYRSED
jgi:hypothetical protein